MSTVMGQFAVDWRRTEEKLEGREGEGRKCCLFGLLMFI